MSDDLTSIAIVLTSQPPSGSPLAASNPADIIIKSGTNSWAANKMLQDRLEMLALLGKMLIGTVK